MNKMNNLKQIIAIFLLFVSFSSLAQLRMTITMINDDTTNFGKTMPIYSIVYDKHDNRSYLLTATAQPTDDLKSATKVPYSLEFNGNRAVKRSGLPQVNAGGQDLFTWIENYFFPFVPATITNYLSSYLIEIGTNYTITLHGGTTLHDETDPKNGEVNWTYTNLTGETAGGQIYTFGTATSYSTTHNFFPKGSNSPATDYPRHRYYARQYGGDGGSWYSSTTRTIEACYPFLHGVSATDYSSGGTAIYSGLTKLIQKKGNKTITLHSAGSDAHIYFAYPSWYGTLSSIIDHNGFDVTASFTRYTANVTSVGKDDNWTEEYYIYQSTLTNPNDWDYHFNF